ncbi:MAG: J domain-containing protein [bacterium]
MSVLSRVYQMFRASFASEKQRDLFDDEGFQDIFSKSYRSQSRTYGADHSSQSSANQDPEIAKYYANLEVPYGSDLETVRTAWKNLLRKYHPDLHSNDSEKVRIANELVQGLNRAYGELEKRLK